MAAPSPLALERLKLREQINISLAAIKEEEECDHEVATALAQAHKIRRSTAMDCFEIKPWRLEIAELRIENGKLKKDLKFSRGETESMIKRNTMLQQKLDEAQRTLTFYSEIIETYQQKLGPYAGAKTIQTDKLYDS